MKPTTSYRPLANEEDDNEFTPLTNDDDIPLTHLDEKSRRAFSSSSSNRLFFWACVGSLICSALNLAFVAFSARPQPLFSVFKSSSSGTQSSESLKRPSVYIGLDRLPLNVSRGALPTELVVFPHVFHPVDRTNPEKVFPTDAHARFTFNGKVSPGDRNILLTQDISMIAQYRVHDFGMERCTITSAMIKESILSENNLNLTLQGNTRGIEIWNLTSSTPTVDIDVRQLSWGSKPKRGRLLGKLDIVRESTTHSEEFYCGPSGSLQAFELVCPGSDCHVDFWQDIYFKPRFGVFVSQHPSL